MKTDNIALVSSEDGDWQGLYMNGQLMVENHSLGPKDILKALGIQYRDLIAIQELMETEGCLPETFSESIINVSMGEEDNE